MSKKDNFLSMYLVYILIALGLCKNLNLKMYFMSIEFCNHSLQTHVRQVEINLILLLRLQLVIQFNLVIHQMLLNLLAIKCKFWCLNLNQVTYFIVPTMNLLFIKRGSYFYSHIILNYESMNHIRMSDSTTKFTKVMIIKKSKFGGLIKYSQ